MKKYLLIFILLCGCFNWGGKEPQPTNKTGYYICPDGTIVEDEKQCPKEPEVYICEGGEIVEDPSLCPEKTYVCPDGSVVKDSSLCPKFCPESCDDNNTCTLDYCSAETNYKCKNEPLSGAQIGCSGSAGVCKERACEEGVCKIKTVYFCCGNGICEAGESCVTCKIDCEECRENITYPELHTIPIYPSELKPLIYNCEDYEVSLSIRNPLPDKNLVVRADEAKSIKTIGGGKCIIPPGMTTVCVVTMSGALGTNLSGMVKVELHLWANEDKERPPYEHIYSKTLTIYVNYIIEYFLRDECYQFFCRQNATWVDPNSKREFTIIGMTNFRDKWMCNAFATEGDMTYEAYFLARAKNWSHTTEWCIVEDSPTTQRKVNCYTR